MGRKPRELETNGFYHVTARRIEGNDLFYEEQDYVRMKTLLQLGAERFGVVYAAYCLMKNHYHLLIMTPQTNLSQFMHWLNSRYSKYHNLAYDYGGHVFQGRYHSQRIDNDSYLLEVSRYIHLNPVRAGITDLPEQYPYSSYRVYVGHSDLVPIVTEYVNEHFVTPQAYKTFVLEGIEPKVQPQSSVQILDSFVRQKGISIEALLNPQNANQRAIRREVVRILAEKTNLSPKEIGQLTGVTSPATLYRLIQK
ncbi:MAG: transposase [Methylocystaceae bacterium]